MQRQIIVSLILIISGILLGFFAMVNWQFYQETQKTALAISSDSQRLDVVEKYLKDNLLPAANKQAQPK